MKLMASLARRHMYKLKAPGGRVGEEARYGQSMVDGSQFAVH